MRRHDDLAVAAEPQGLHQTGITRRCKSIDVPHCHVLWHVVSSGMRSLGLGRMWADNRFDTEFVVFQGDGNFGAVSATALLTGRRAPMAAR